MAIPDVSGKSIPELLSLRGRNAVVTGGARGIGLAICQRLAEAGANIVVGDVREDLGKEAAEHLAQQWGVKALFCVADVSDGVSIAHLADKTVQELGGIDIWVNNAAIYPHSPVLEMSDEQWEAVMGSSPYTLPRSNNYYDLPGMAERLTNPTNPATVSWNDAQEFITRLNQREGHDRYRLPTEAEWEYAARAGTTTAYSFGDDDNDLGDYAWYGEDFASGSTHPVGQKQPNPCGLQDMHGNVWEWVQDWYDAGYYEVSPAADPQGPQTGSRRVMRGGSWHVTAISWRSAFRRNYDPDYRGISIGFRLVLSVNE